MWPVLGAAAAATAAAASGLSLWTKASGTGTRPWAALFAAALSAAATSTSGEGSRPQTLGAPVSAKKALSGGIWIGDM